MTVNHKRLNRNRLRNHLEIASRELGYAYHEIGSSPTRHNERARVNLALAHIDGLLSLLSLLDETTPEGVTL